MALTRLLTGAPLLRGRCRRPGSARPKPQTRALLRTAARASAVGGRDAGHQVGSCSLLFIRIEC